MSNSGLIVRRSERFEISIPARVRISAINAENVLFAKGVTDADRWVQVDIVDFAQGGVGFVSDLFFARGVNLDLEIRLNEDTNSDPMLQTHMMVKRVQMTDRRPAYLIGCSFVDSDEQTQESISELLFRLSGDANAGNDDGVGYA